jgi:hypothetical protein
LRGSFRYQLQLQSAEGDVLREIVRKCAVDLKLPADVSWIADVDPLDMM